MLRPKNVRQRILSERTKVFFQIVADLRRSLVLVSPRAAQADATNCINATIKLNYIRFTPAAIILCIYYLCMS